MIPARDSATKLDQHRCTAAAPEIWIQPQLLYTSATQQPPLYTNILPTKHRVVACTEYSTSAVVFRLAAASEWLRDAEYRGDEWMLRCLATKQPME